MKPDLESYVGEYVASEYFSFLRGPVREHAESVLVYFLREAAGMAPDFPDGADAGLFARVLMERVARLDLPLTVRQGAPGLLAAFGEYLAASGKYPEADAWGEWAREAEGSYLARFRGDGSVKGETVRKRFADVGRNDPCPCGSGRKFKKCCMALLI